ncbi:uncharacterized protein RBU57_002988 [Macrochelys suwanniensis]
MACKLLSAGTCQVKVICEILEENGSHLTESRDPWQHYKKIYLAKGDNTNSSKRERTSNHKRINSLAGKLLNTEETKILLLPQHSPGLALNYQPPSPSRPPRPVTTDPPPPREEGLAPPRAPPPRPGFRAAPPPARSLCYDGKGEGNRPAGVAALATPAAPAARGRPPLPHAAGRRRAKGGSGSGSGSRGAFRGNHASRPGRGKRQEAEGSSPVLPPRPPAARGPAPRSHLQQPAHEGGVSAGQGPPQERGGSRGGGGCPRGAGRGRGIHGDGGGPRSAALSELRLLRSPTRTRHLTVTPAPASRVIARRRQGRRGNPEAGRLRISGPSHVGRGRRSSPPPGGAGAGRQPPSLVLRAQPGPGRRRGGSAS